MRYDEAFDAVLRERYDLLSDEEVRAAERPRQGRLRHDDQDCYAIVDAYRNHRCHTDAFALAMEELRGFLGAGETICVVDLGAGAGNVAAAFCESWEPADGGRVSYVGVEPHAMMRRLGIAFLRNLAPSWMDFRFVEACSGLAIPQADRYLVTLHYVVHQPGVRPDDLVAWADLVARMHSRGPTCVLSVSARSISPELETIDCTPAFLREMTLAGLSFDTSSTSARMDRRMPRADAGGWVLQAARGEGWHNVRIERYRMTSRTPSREGPRCS